MLNMRTIYHNIREIGFELCCVLRILAYNISLYEKFGEYSNIELDKYDHALIACLKEDGRLTNAELAQRINLSPSACHKRFKRLESEGVITGYTVILNPDAVGRTQNIFVQVTLDKQDNKTIQTFELTVQSVPEIAECYLMSGSYDYLMLVQVSDTAAYERLHRDVLTSLPGVSRISSHFALRAVTAQT